MHLLPRRTTRILSFGIASALLMVLPASARAVTVTVNDGGDSTNACATSGTGTCTLRDALTYANAHSGTTIAFGIAGAGVHTITPGSAYPLITAAVTIDGFTQPGSTPNTNGSGLGDNSTHLIEIDGANTGAGVQRRTRFVVRPADVHRRVPRSALSLDVRQLDRAARQREHHLATAAEATSVPETRTPEVRWRCFSRRRSTCSDPAVSTCSTAI